MDNENNKNIQFGVTSHYNQYTGFEVIDVCEQLRAPDGMGNFNRGNAFKYLARAGWKNPDKHIEDLEKAVNYIQREIDRLKAAGASATETQKFEEARAYMKEWHKNNPCPTCQSGGTRMTVGMVCQTCGRDYSNGERGVIGSSMNHIDVASSVVFGSTPPGGHWLDGMEDGFKQDPAYLDCDPRACPGSGCVLNHPPARPERMVDPRIVDGSTPPARLFTIAPNPDGGPSIHYCDTRTCPGEICTMKHRPNNAG